MSTNLIKRESISESIERVVIGGDLARLSADERVSYYQQICASVGLNPLTRPFDYITLNNKLTLYARKDATDQLRAINQISVTIQAREVTEDCYVVTARAATPAGRTDESIGAVSIGNLKGEARCNAMMKAETKAKRRVTLSISGLGLLDESELETIPESRKKVVEVTESDIPLKAAGAASGPVAQVVKTNVIPQTDADSTGEMAPPEHVFTKIEKAMKEEKPKKKTDPNYVKHPDCITLGQQTNFRNSWHEAATGSGLAHSQLELLRHDYLGRHGYVDKDGNPTSALIKTAEFVRVRDEAIKFAKDLNDISDVRDTDQEPPF